MAEVAGGRPRVGVVLVAGDPLAGDRPVSTALRVAGLEVRVVRLGREACAALDRMDDLGLVLLDLTASGPGLDLTLKTFHVMRVADRIPLWGLVAARGEGPDVDGLRREVLADQGVGAFVDLGAAPEVIGARVRRFLFTGDERRRERRVSVYLPVDYGDGTAQEIHGHLTDLSLGGAFLQASELHAAGAYLSLRFQVPGSARALTPAARVRYVVQKTVDDPAYLRSGMGLAFEDLDPRQRADLALYLESAARDEDAVAPGAEPTP